MYFRYPYCACRDLRLFVAVTAFWIVTGGADVDRAGREGLVHWISGKFMIMSKNFEHTVFSIASSAKLVSERAVIGRMIART